MQSGLFNNPHKLTVTPLSVALDLPLLWELSATTAIKPVLRLKMTLCKRLFIVWAFCCGFRLSGCLKFGLNAWATSCPAYLACKKMLISNIPNPYQCIFLQKQEQVQKIPNHFVYLVCFSYIHSNIY